jgi:hypothetical protein
MPRPRTTSAIGIAAMLQLGLVLSACRNDDNAAADDGTTGDATTDASPPTSTTPGDTTADADSTSETDDGTTGDDPSAAIPPPGGLRRLLAHQYVGTIDLLLGPSASAVAAPPADPSIGGFDAVAAAELALSPTDIEQYERSANAIAEATIADPITLAQWVPCVMDGTESDACYETLARDFGRLAWRRPLTDEEVAAYSDLGRTTRADDDGAFATGIRYMVSALLQSPRFLYIVEVGVPADDGGARELTQYEMASRLSFFLLGRGPSATLLARAEDGELDEDGIRETAAQLLGQSAARGVVARFYDELLTIRGLPAKGKDPELFPLFSPELAESMRQETQRLIEDIVFEQDGDVFELIDADYTYVDERLAELYGVEAPPPGEWQQTSLPAEQHRAGILTHASVLTMFSHGEVNSPTRRGLFVEERLLCTDIPPTPPDVNPVLPPSDEPMSLRDRLEMLHLTSASCAGCHTKIDPVGFAYEHFDPIGAYRTLDNGFPIDSASQTDAFGEFADASELATAIRSDPRLPQCLVDQVYTAALGFARTEDQAPALDTVGEAFVASEHNMRLLLIELVASPMFRRVDEPK